MNDVMKTLLDVRDKMLRVERAEEKRLQKCGVELKGSVSLAAGASAHPDNRITATVSGYIGEFTYDELSSFLDEAGGDPVSLRLFSYGGSAYAGIALFDLLRSYSGDTDIVVHGIAASAAATMLQGADTRRAAEGASLMIHPAWSLSIGYAKELRETADLLDQITDLLAELMALRGVKTKEEFLAMILEKDQYLTGKEAKAYGLLDEYNVVDKQERAEPESEPEQSEEEDEFRTASLAANLHALDIFNAAAVKLRRGREYRSRC